MTQTTVVRIPGLDCPPTQCCVHPRKRLSFEVRISTRNTFLISFVVTAGAAAANYTSLSSALAASPNNTASVFVQAVAAAGLGDAVLNVSSFTIFIPTDAVSCLPLES